LEIRLKLFIYDHCPYCVRAWMPLGIKNIPCELVVMLNDDVETPTAMIGKKMVPILELDDGTYIPESLDIVAYLDENFGESATFAPFSKRADLAAWVDQFKGTMNDLCLPRVPQAPLKEFATASAREYFTRARTAYIGDFAALMAETPAQLQIMNEGLRQFGNLLRGEYVNETLSYDDIDLFAKLRGLTLVAGCEWPTRTREYVDAMSAKSGVSLYDDFAI